MKRGTADTGEEAELDEVERHRMPLIEHLVELRTRMMWSLAALALGMLSSFLAVDMVYAWLTEPFVAALAETGATGGLALVNSPTEGIYTWLRVGFVGGVVLASPMLALQVWLFVAPGLYQTEQRIVMPLAMISTALFLSGGGFAYYAIFPFAFPFFLQVIDAQATISISGYISTITRMMLAFGVCFQMPVVTFFIARMGLIDHKDMVNAFRYAVVGIFVVAAMITPPDVMTQSLLALPLIVLYGVSIVVAWAVTTKKRD